MEIKYIYFEVKILNDGEPTIENENILMIKPHTNLCGIWGFTNISDLPKQKRLLITEQNWVDLDKFNDEGSHVYDGLRKHVKIALEKINERLFIDWYDSKWINRADFRNGDMLLSKFIPDIYQEFIRDTHPHERESSSLI